MAASRKPQIDNIGAFTDHGLIELKSWLEPWFQGGRSGTGGSQGATGPQGPTGPAGPAGPAATSYTHVQGAAAPNWTVSHNLSRFPSVTVIDTGDNQILPDLHYVSANQLTLAFGSATSGKAYLN